MACAQTPAPLALAVRHPLGWMQATGRGGIYAQSQPLHLKRDVPAGSLPDRAADVMSSRALAVMSRTGVPAVPFTGLIPKGSLPRSAAGHTLRPARSSASPSGTTRASAEAVAPARDFLREPSAVDALPVIAPARPQKPDHDASLPCLAAPSHALPRLAMPSLTLPRVPCQAAPSHTLPRLAMPCPVPRALPCRAHPGRAMCSAPCPARPRQTVPCQAWPCRVPRAVPGHATPCPAVARRGCGITARLGSPSSPER